MCRFPMDRPAISSALTSGMPPPSSVASVRASCAVENFRATSPAHGSRRSARSIRSRTPGCRTQYTRAMPASATAASTSRMLWLSTRGAAHDDPRDQRQLRVEARVELGKRRHQLQHDDADHHDRQAHEHRRVDQRGNRLAPHRAGELRVRDVSAQHHLEAAAALASHQRRRVNAGKERAVLLERVAQGGTGLDPLVDGVEHRPEQRIRDATTQQVERLDEAASPP